MRTWFVADTHFGSAHLVADGSRPFGSAAQMDAALIRNWNETVGDGDEVWHLGDFGSDASPEYLRWVFCALKGRKRLVQGNWDEAHPQALALPWASPPEKHLGIRVEGIDLFLCHYPMLSWPMRREGGLHLYGHTHGQVPGCASSADVGVDAWGHRPASLEAIRSAMAGRAAPADRLAA